MKRALMTFRVARISRETRVVKQHSSDSSGKICKRGFRDGVALAVLRYISDIQCEMKLSVWRCDLQPATAGTRPTPTFSNRMFFVWMIDVGICGCVGTRRDRINLIFRGFASELRRISCSGARHVR